MFEAKMRQLIKLYCASFEENWVQEEYKWKEIKRFQNHYSKHCASDHFTDMLRRSFNLSSNLIASKHYYPANEIIKLSERNPQEVQNTLNLLLYGEDDILVRIEQFKKAFSDMKAEADFSGSDGTDIRFISTLLFYAHPEEYAIYKYTEIKKFAQEFDTGITIRAGKTDCILQTKALTDMIIDFLNSEKQTDPFAECVLKQYELKMESDEYYHDAEYRVLAHNIIWYATAYQVVLPETERESKAVGFGHGILSKSNYSAEIRNHGRKIDHLKKAKENTALGISGEQFVLEYENSILKNGKTAVWKSQNEGDGLGYDILSYDENGKKKYIEVKTTNGSQDTVFYITAVELAAAEKYGDQYYLYRVYVENGERKIAYYKGSEIKQLCNCPALYIVAK